MMNRILPMTLSFVLAACANGSNFQAEQASSNFEQNVCKSSVKTNLWNELYRMAEEGKGFPQGRQLSQHLKRRLLAHWGSQLSPLQQAKVKEIAERVASAYEQTLQESLKTAGNNKADVDDEDPHRQVVRRLAQLELGDASTVQSAQLQTKLSAELAKIQSELNEIDSSCATATALNTDALNAVVELAAPDSTSELLKGWKARQPRALYGAWKTMATAYQSCEAVKMDPLTDRTSDVVGVTWYQKPKVTASGGNWRYFTSRSAFINSNPYYKRYISPNSSKCIEVTRNPLVYDFGGKPYYISSSAPSLNLFKNSGSGSPDVLGLDCSAFIVTSHFTAGLKLSSANPLRAAYIDAIGARTIKNPKANGLDCLKPISVSSSRTLKPGDVLASNTHVVMIDQVGTDPFGIAKLTKVSQCSGENISTRNFNFTIIQSAPTKGSIGINRIQASGYLAEEPALQTALEKYALAACQAKFGNEITPEISEATLVRHTGEAKCMAIAINLDKQECLNDCSAN